MREEQIIQVKQFWDKIGIDETDYVLLRVIKPNGGVVREVIDVPDRLLRLNYSEPLHYFYTPVPREGREPIKEYRNKPVRYVRVLFSDIDEWTEDELKRFQERAPHLYRAAGIVKSGRGLHLYFPLETPIPVSEMEEYSRKLAELLAGYFRVDPHFRTTGPNKLLRVPYSLNPKVGRYAEIEKLPESSLPLSFFESEETTKSQREVITALLIEELEPYYKKGVRHFIAGAVAGILRKKLKLPLEDAIEVMKAITDYFNDPEGEDRLRFVYDTYAKPIESVSWFEWFRRIKDVYPDFHLSKLLDLQSSPESYEVKTTFLKDGRKTIAYYQDMSQRKIFKVILKEDKIISSETVAYFTIENARVLYDQFARQRYYEITIKYKDSRDTHIIPVDELRRFLESEPIATSQARDAIIHIVESKTREQPVVSYMPVKGILFAEDKLILSSIEKRVVTVEELREALLLLDQLASFYRAEERAIFSTLVKWSISSVLNFARKQAYQKGFITVRETTPHVLLIGAAKSGKTTVANIAISLHPIRQIKPGSAISTPARMGQAVSYTTFPIQADEVKELFSREDTLDILKNTYDQIVAREIISQGRSKIFYAAGYLLMTANDIASIPDSIRRRLLIISMNRKKADKAREFERALSRAYLLEKIGYVVLEQLQSAQKVREILSMPWEEAGQFILTRLYEATGLTPPAWLSESYTTETEDEGEEVDIFIELLLEYIEKETWDQTDSNPVKRLENKLRRGTDWGIYADGDLNSTLGVWRVYMTGAALRNLKKLAKEKDVVIEFPNLEAIAYRLGLSLVENKYLTASLGSSAIRKKVKKAVDITPILQDYMAQRVSELEVREIEQEEIPEGIRELL